LIETGEPGGQRQELIVILVRLTEVLLKPSNFLSLIC